MSIIPFCQPLARAGLLRTGAAYDAARKRPPTDGATGQLQMPALPSARHSPCLLAAACRRGRVEFLPEYDVSRVVPEVFNKVDCIVVPSIWCTHRRLDLR